MKQTKIFLRLTEAPFDDKCIICDAVLDNLFDDARYTSEKNETVGFICGFPSFVIIQDNFIKAKMCADNHSFDNVRVWVNSVVERITGNEYKDVLPALVANNHVRYMDEESGLVADFLLRPDHICIVYYVRE